VDENDASGLVTITVDRVGGSAGTVSVDYETADGTANAGSDYTAAMDTLTWLDGDATSQSFNVNISDDLTYEGDEDFSVALSNAVGANIGAPSSAVVTIVEDDPGPGVLQLSAADYSVAENGGMLTVTVDRVGGSAGAVSVDFNTQAGTATDGLDYTGTAGTLSWVDGDAVAQDINVTILDDLTYEGDEDFAIILTNPSGAPLIALGTPSVAVATILEDEPAPNVAPVANDDTTEIQRGTTLTNYNIVANDEDSDGTINAASVFITTGGITQRGGSVVSNDDGTITYTTPNAGWTGTDTFQYTVNDDDGATSNVATVRINVVR
jgi:hypothetical protein